MTTRERPKRSEVQTPGNTPTRKQRSISPSVAKIKIEGRRVPGNIYVPRKKGPPKGNIPEGVKSLTAPGFAGNTVAGAANVVELARALRNDVDLIFEFVYNNIEFIPTYGSQKGAYGTLVDGFGNAFDQSELMIELLREAGYTCSFQHGELELTEAETAAWLGNDVTSIWAASNLLGNCGVPNETHWTGTEWKLRVAHCWVKVTIDTTDYVFDPAMKAYNVVSSTIDLETALDYDRTDFMNDATNGATITSDYVLDMNRTNVRNNLAALTENLVDYLKTNAPAATLTDILGGREIAPVTAPVRLTALPYLRLSTTPTTWTDIPNAYKCTFGVLYDDPNIDVTFYSKDIHGKRLTLTFNASHECELRLDGDLVATSDPQIPDSWNSVLLSITHPTADPWWDQSFWQTVYEGHPYLIGQAWGNAGNTMAIVHKQKLDQFLFDGGSAADEEVICEALSTWFHSWNAEKCWVADVFNRMTNCTTALQHQVGLIGHFDTPSMDLGGIMWSSGALDNDYDNVDTNDTALAMHGIAFEGGTIEQLVGIGGICTTTLLDKAVSDGLKIYDGRDDNWSTNVRPNLTNYSSQSLDDIENWYLNWDWRVAIPEDGEITKDDFIGMGYYAISPWYGAIGIISGYLQGSVGAITLGGGDTTTRVSGGCASATPNVPILCADVNPNGGGSGGASIKVPFRPNSSDPVELLTGTYMYDHVDLTVGSKVFPYGLSFQRFYRSNWRLKGGPLGYGWTHNHAINAHSMTDGLVGMSTRNPIQGAAGLAQMFVTVDLYRDLSKPLDKWVTVAMANRWMLDQLWGNQVEVNMPEGALKFTKLPDSSFVPPLGFAHKLTEAGGLYTMTTPQGVEYNFDSDGNIATIEFPYGVVITYTYSSGKLTSVTNGMGRTLSFTYTGDELASVSDGNGRSVSFTIDGTGNLVAVTDPMSEDTTYEYDQPGRMTKIFKPENPMDEIVSNTYDTLGRVKEQRDAYNNLTSFYIAGHRTEEVDPENNSEIKYFDGNGQIFKSIDKVGKTWLAEYDGLLRRIKVIAPETNSTEYEFDGMNNVMLVTHKAKNGSGLADIVTSFTYDPAWNKVATATDPREKVTSFTYDEVTGRLLTVEFPEVDAGVPTSSFKWNERGQLISKIDAEGMQTQFSFDDTTEVLDSVIVNTDWKATIGGTATAGDTLSIIATDAEIAGGSKTKSYTVTVGNTLEDAAAGLVDAINGDTELLSLGITAKAIDHRVMLSSVPDSTTTFSSSTSGGSTSTISLTAGLSLVTAFAYDSVGNMISLTNARGDEATFEFDALRRLTKGIAPEPFVYETKFTFDKNNNMTKVERFAGLDGMDEPIWQTSMASYTLDGLLESVTDPGNNVTEFSYDSRRLLETTEDAASRVVTRTYDAAGRILTVVDAGSVTQVTNTYSDNGHLLSLEDANENVTEYEFDGFDRLKKKILPDLSFEQNNFDEFGRVVSVVTRAGDEIAFEWDDLGRLVERAPDGMPVVTFEHDLVGRLKKIMTPTVSGDPGSGVFEYLHDTVGRLIAERYPDAKEVQYQHDEIGNVIRMIYPDSFYVDRVFDELNRLTGIRVNGAVGNAVAFDYDPLSRRTKLTYENGVETDYGIEIDNDLTSLTQTFTGSSVAFTYGFNNVHELSSQSVDDSSYLWHPITGGTTAYAAVNELNQYPMVGSNSFVYNANGCLTENGGWSFDYDTVNQLVGATDGVVSASYVYDPNGRQAQKNVGGVKTRYIHAGIRSIAEYDGTTGDFKKRFVHGIGIDEILLEVDDADDVTYLHHDRIGSVIATTDDTGSVINSYAYSPWGQCESMVGTTFGFQGQRFDQETGLYFMKARHYDPTVGRFLQPDPIGYGDGLNLYQFAYNNPNSFTDPLGLSADGSTNGSDTGTSGSGGNSPGTDDGTLDWTSVLEGASDFLTHYHLEGSLPGGSTNGGYGASLDGSSNQSYELYYAYWEALGLTGQMHVSLLVRLKGTTTNVFTVTGINVPGSKVPQLDNTLAIGKSMSDLNPGYNVAYVREINQKELNALSNATSAMISLFKTGGPVPYLGQGTGEIKVGKYKGLLGTNSNALASTLLVMAEIAVPAELGFGAPGWGNDVRDVIATNSLRRSLPR